MSIAVGWLCLHFVHAGSILLHILAVAVFRFPSSFPVSVTNRLISSKWPPPKQVHANRLRRVRKRFDRKCRAMQVRPAARLIRSRAIEVHTSTCMPRCLEANEAARRPKQTIANGQKVNRTT